MKLRFVICLPTQPFTAIRYILPCGRGELCHVFHDNYFSIDRYFQARRLLLLSSSCFLLVLASISLNFNSDLFSSINYLHGRSNCHLLTGRETSLVSGTRYSSALSFEPKVETTIRAGDFKIDIGLCNCYIDAVDVV